MKKFIVDKEIFDIFPNLSIGILALNDVNENISLDDKSLKEIKEILDNANLEARKYLTSDVISENEVVRVWREAYQKFPNKKGARCSVENLLKRVLHDNPVGTIVPSVDITNAISLKCALPIGVEDLGKVDGDIHLGVMKGGEDFLPIGSEEQDPPLPGEVAYYDNFGVICRCLNWRDGIRTEVTDNTIKEFIAMECIDSTRVNELKAAIDELEILLKRYLNVSIINKQIIDVNNNEMNIE